MGDNKYLEADKQLAFISGHWQKEMPTKPGTYPVANRQGFRTGHSIEVLNPADPPTNLALWWWSEPYPELPKPLEWDATIPPPIDVEIIAYCSVCHTELRAKIQLGQSYIIVEPCLNCMQAVSDAPCEECLQMGSFQPKFLKKDSG